MDASSSIGQAMLAGLATSFRYHKDLAERAMAQIADAQLHVALDAGTNSIAVIMQHVAGNLRSRWTDFLTSDGEKPWRNRDEEFVDAQRLREELISDWERGWQCLFDALESLTADDLARSVLIRGEGLSVPLAACRSLAHTAYHVGQIVMIARVLFSAPGDSSGGESGKEWQTLTIPRSGSRDHNQRVWGTQQYGAGSSSAAAGQAT